MSIELRPRLAAALDLLGNIETLADVGCDHGRFGAAALQRGICKSVIASDVSFSSLEKAVQLSKKLGFESKMRFVCSDGLSALEPGAADGAALLGMGGELIVSILKSGADVARSLKRIVMQPMRGETELRQYLYENGYRVLDEAVVLDSGRYYQLISACYTAEKADLPAFWPEGYYQFGAVAFLKRESELLPMMQRYLSIIDAKLQAAEKRGSLPEKLMREAEFTRIIINQYLNRSEVENKTNGA